MRILFYQDLPSINSTLLTWTLCEELRILGHQVDYWKPVEPMPGKYDWIHGSGTDAGGALWFARKSNAKCHIHLEGVAYWRIGYENAVDWGYDQNHTPEEIKQYVWMYKDWMQHAYEADSCTVNGPKQVKAIEWMFGGRKLPNCHLISCGADARYALTLPEYPKENYMVTVSRLEPNKKVFKIAEALAILKSQGYMVPLWLVIGYGTFEQMYRLDQFCKDHSIAYVLYLCFGAEKWYWIKRAKLMLAGWSGIPPEEAIVCKVPCLIFNDADIEMAFERTLWYADDPTDYAERIGCLLDNKNSELIKARNENAFNLILGRKYIEKNRLLFANTQERAASQYSEIFSGKAKPYQEE